MVEIIPNWHPIFVHFTVALFTTSVAFYAFSFSFKKLKHCPKLATEWEIVAKWCLWLSAIIVLGTIWAGFYAYYTVNHDAPSHIIMTDHRNWAIPTVSAIVLVALWSLWRDYNRRAITVTFILVLLVAQGLLLSTAWRGAELVFRYGVGVMSIPKSEGPGHQHHHEEADSKMEHQQSNDHEHNH